MEQSKKTLNSNLRLGCFSLFAFVFDLVLLKSKKYEQAEKVKGKKFSFLEQWDIL